MYSKNKVKPTAISARVSHYPSASLSLSLPWLDVRVAALRVCASRDLPKLCDGATVPVVGVERQASSTTPKGLRQLSGVNRQKPRHSPKSVPLQKFISNHVAGHRAKVTASQLKRPARRGYIAKGCAAAPNGLLILQSSSCSLDVLLTALFPLNGDSPCLRLYKHLLDASAG